MTIVELTPEDLVLFMAFRQHQQAITSILSSGMLDQRGATIQLYVNEKGIITSIDIVKKPLFSTRAIASAPD